MKIENLGVVVSFIIGFYFVILPLIPGRDSLNLIWIVIGLLFIILGVSGLYLKALISRKIYEILLISLFFIVSFLGFYSYINIPESRNILGGIILIVSILAALYIVYILINRGGLAKYQKGVELLDSMKYEEALEYFDAYAKLHSDDPLAWSGKSIALLKLNKVEEALECVDKALKIDMGINRFLIKKTLHSIRVSAKGAVLCGFEKYEDALECFDEVLKLKPGESAAWVNKGIVLSRLGEYGEALKCYDNALGFDLNDPRALANKGETLRKLGKYSEAVENIDKALDIDPELPVAWLNMGKLLRTLNEREESLKSIEIALKLDPLFKDAIKAREEAKKERKLI